MMITSIIYLIVYALFLLLLFFSRSIENVAHRSISWALDYNFERIPLFFHIFAWLCILYYAYRIYMAGDTWTGLDTLSRRAMLSSEYISYINIYMVAYTNKSIISMLVKKNNPVMAVIKTITPVVFWGLYLYTTARRYFMLVVPAVAIALLARKQSIRVSKKWIVGIVASVTFLLTMGARRVFLSLSGTTVVYYLHNTFAEFIYTYYPSCYFVGYKYNLIWGSSYIYDTITKWIPRALFPLKPLDLDAVFFQMSGINISYSFNPIAEGLYNFKWGALIVVPIILFLFKKVVNYSLKYSSVLYMTFLAAFVGFMRGSLSNSVLDMVMITLLMLLMNVHNGKIEIIKHNDF